MISVCVIHAALRLLGVGDPPPPPPEEKLGFLTKLKVPPHNPPRLLGEGGSPESV